MSWQDGSPSFSPQRRVAGGRSLAQAGVTSDEPQVIWISPKDLSARWRLHSHDRSSKKQLVNVLGKNLQSAQVGLWVEVSMERTLL